MVKFVEVFMQQIFDGVESSHIVHQLFYTIACTVDYFVVGAGDTFSDRLLYIIDAGRSPRFHGKPNFIGGKQYVGAS
jgi:hypothetical protein